MEPRPDRHYLDGFERIVCPTCGAHERAGVHRCAVCHEPLEAAQPAEGGVSAD